MGIFEWGNTSSIQDSKKKDRQTDENIVHINFSEKTDVGKAVLLTVPSEPVTVPAVILPITAVAVKFPIFPPPLPFSELKEKLWWCCTCSVGWCCTCGECGLCECCDSERKASVAAERMALSIFSQSGDRACDAIRGDTQYK
jgi:hypothetical protein